jgi:uncharacterized protein
MIETCFTIFEGISEKTEATIKIQGIKDWNAFLKKDTIKGISSKRKAFYNSRILSLKQALRKDDISLLATHIPLHKQWMLYKYYKEDALFIDIEVTGVKKDDYVFLIAIYDGINTKLMIRDINLNLQELKKFLAKYPMLISFNGTVHDIPFLKKRYPDLFSDVLHMDLRFLTQKISFRGGLKKIEKLLGIKRTEIQEKYRSGDIKRLWRMWKGSGDKYYLNLLIEYAEDDVISLKKIAECTIDRLKKEIHK